MTEYRIEHDTMGEVKVPADALWRAQTQRAVDNFPISGRGLENAQIRALGLLKAACAQVNKDSGKLDADKADAIIAAATEIAEGKHNDAFPIDVFQTGSGTSSNMNTNEVIASLAHQNGVEIHPNDHVTMGQSSNDTFPTATHVAATEAAVNDLIPGLKVLHESLSKKAKEFADVVKAGRTHLMDATPVTLGQEFGGYARQIELAIERAKRLVEQGKDVVVLLDSITRLGRAYNNSSPASGRILSGGVDSNALYPPKRFLGAARNIEEGGSLTIIATAMVETGSTGDTVIFEEFKGTGNAELKLDRGISERRVFPAVDVNPSGTRKDELLLVPEEARIMTKLRRILSALDSHQAIDLLIKQLKKTRSNGEFLMQVASSAPMAADKDEEDYV